MDPLDMMWRGVGVPVLTSTAVLLAAMRPWRRNPAPGSDSWTLGFAAALAVAAGYAAGHLALANWSWPGFPPADTTHWSLFLAGAALPLVLLEGQGSLAPLVRWTLRALFVVAAMLVVSLPLIRSGMTLSSAVWTALLAAGTLAWWGAMEGCARRIAPAAFVITLLLLLSGASLALVISGTGLVAQLVGALAAAAGPLLLVNFVRGGRMRPGSFLPVVAVVLGALWANGVLYTYAELGGISALVVAAAVAPLASVWSAPLRRMAESPRRLVRWIAVGAPAGSAIAPLAAAVALAISRSAEMAY